MKIVRGIRQFVSNSSVSVRALVVSNRGISPLVSNSCISVRALGQETKASMDDSIAMLIKADGFIFKEWTGHCLLARVFVIFRTSFLHKGMVLPSPQFQFYHKRSTQKAFKARNVESTCIVKQDSCTGSIISELYQLYDMAVDVTFHNSIPRCKRIRIIIAVIVYTPFVLTYVIKQWSSTE